MTGKILELKDIGRETALKASQYVNDEANGFPLIFPPSIFFKAESLTFMTF